MFIVAILFMQLVAVQASIDISGIFYISLDGGTTTTTGTLVDGAVLITALLTPYQNLQDVTTIKLKPFDMEEMSIEKDRYVIYQDGSLYYIRFHNYSLPEILDNEESITRVIENRGNEYNRWEHSIVLLLEDRDILGYIAKEVTANLCKNIVCEYHHELVCFKAVNFRPVPQDQGAALVDIDLEVSGIIACVSKQDTSDYFLVQKVHSDDEVLNTFIDW